MLTDEEDLYEMLVKALVLDPDVPTGSRTGLLGGYQVNIREAVDVFPVLDRILEALTAANRLIPEGADRITRAGHATMTSNETKENKTA